MNLLRKWLIGEEYINFLDSDREAVRSQFAYHLLRIKGHDQLIEDQRQLICEMSKEFNDLRNQLAVQQPVEAPAAGRRPLPWSKFKPLLEAQPQRRS